MGLKIVFDFFGVPLERDPPATAGSLRAGEQGALQQTTVGAKGRSGELVSPDVNAPFALLPGSDGKKLVL